MRKHRMKENIPTKVVIRTTTTTILSKNLVQKMYDYIIFSAQICPLKGATEKIVETEENSEH